MTAIDMEREQQHRERAMFENEIEAFIKHYADFIPLDERDEFHMRVHGLVRIVYHDAQKPILKHLEKICSAMAASMPIRGLIP